jgi:SAM-dependent methyltransferase
VSFLKRIAGAFHFLFSADAFPKRPLKDLWQQYAIEKGLANKLRKANREERQRLYSAVYDQLFRLLPNHPQLAVKKDVNSCLIEASQNANLLKHFLTQNSTFLEIGPGDCSFSFWIAQYVKKVYAVDVSKEITVSQLFPRNFKLIISDDGYIPLNSSSVDIAYSKHLLEHLHPEDAFEQLCQIRKILTRDGRYVCITPNRLSGPHDISKHFGLEATGLHLKEYTVAELEDLFRKAGFSDVENYMGGKGFYIRFPLLAAKTLERVLSVLPLRLSRKISATLIFRILLGINLVGKKSSDSLGHS